MGKRLLFLLLFAAITTTSKAACYMACILGKVVIVTTDDYGNVTSHVYVESSSCPFQARPDVRAIKCNVSVGMVSPIGGPWDPGFTQFLNDFVTVEAFSPADAQLRADFSEGLSYGVSGTHYVRASDIHSESLRNFLIQNAQ